MKKEKLIIIAAPSGSGKTTIVKELLSSEKLNLGFSISLTTRVKRDNEINGKDYHFVSVSDFKEKIRNNDFIEWEEVYKNVYYGTTKSEIKRLNIEEKNIVFDMDVVGGLNVKTQFPNTSISIFIKPPGLIELKRRLINRKTESQKSIEFRIDKATKELEYSDKYDFVIINDNLELAIKEIKEIIYQFIKTQ
ncbi:guanylate kinase [Flavobacteriaceae bacterium]|jgi:guanylate kinase|nr:guanylate kinase [Flavobacteriaceae bacterium]MDA8904238.1 guanylate kinase [Flavobacteriaceae bacterium]MDA9284737.1 guanylate kinase [Flavobacteriaceae bacterium]MDA9572880.1 guanylate kinase [Flavobacteriaceae bacterium]MDC1310200.1 guanylate kinase [Flavobacteriaceae bacterium]|tara:strand:- start:652 stop:1227 length:576 start_codon:yes stop_codon:yes gene_type:complete